MYEASVVKVIFYKRVIGHCRAYPVSDGGRQLPVAGSISYVKK